MRESLLKVRRWIQYYPPMLSVFEQVHSMFMQWLRLYDFCPYQSDILWVYEKMPTGLSHLDDDVLLHVFSELDLPSLLAFRQTSRSIYLLSKRPCVWTNSLPNVRKFHPHLYPYLERRLDTYIAADLERAVLRMIKLQANWTSDRPTPVRMRELPWDGIKSMALVPGGRWLLARKTGNPSCIESFDLNPPDINSAGDALIQPFDPEEVAGTGHMVLSIPQADSGLQFDIALVSQSEALNAVGARRLSIWSVTFDSNQDKLAAIHRNSFNINTHGYEVYSLRDGLVSHLNRLLDYGYVVEILDRAQSSPTTHCKTVIRLGKMSQPDGPIRLMPNNRLLVMYRDWIGIYDIPELETVPATHHALEPTDHGPIWSMRYARPVDNEHLTISPMLRDHPAFLVSNGVKLYRIEYPQELGSVDYSVVELWSGSSTRYEYMCLGDSRGIAYDTINSITKIQCLTRHASMGRMSEDDSLSEETDSDEEEFSFGHGSHGRWRRALSFGGLHRDRMGGRYTIPETSHQEGTMLDEQFGRVIMTVTRRSNGGGQDYLQSLVMDFV